MTHENFVLRHISRKCQAISTTTVSSTLVNLYATLHKLIFYNYMYINIKTSASKRSVDLTIGRLRYDT